MRKLTLLITMLFLSLGMAWAQTATLESSTSVDSPEYRYRIKSGNGFWMAANTAPTENNVASFAFFAVDDDFYKIYSFDKKQWVSYDKSDGSNNCKDFVKFAASQGEANAWKITQVTRNSQPVYQIQPQNNDGSVSNRYMNWNGGVGANGHYTYDDTRTVGIWKDNASNDGGSAWILTRECDYSITDEAGNVFEGEYLPNGDAAPTFTGFVKGNVKGEFANGKFIGTITFPFPVSKEGGVTNMTTIASAAADKRWLATDNSVIMVQTSGYDVNDNNWLWAIYPQFNNGAFTFKIKSIGQDKWIYTNVTGSKVDGGNDDGSAGNAAGAVQLSGEATQFDVVNSNSVVAFHCKVNNNNQYLSINSKNDTKVYLGVHTGVHVGTDCHFSRVASYVYNFVSFDGEGTAASPYIINNEEMLVALRDAVNGGEAFEGKYFKLTSDIALNGEWTAIGNGSRSSKTYTGNAFKGVFDGDNNTISSLTITSTTAADAAIGLFGVVDGGTVKNLNLTNVNINVSNSNLAGAAIGMMLNGATAEGITVSGAVVGNDGVGGIVGRLVINGTIANCTNNASVTSNYGGIGGIVGKAYYEDGANTATFASITNCTNNGTITAPMYVGGIAGLARANVSGCVNEGAIVGGTQTGGIIGQLIAAGTVSGNENKATVRGTSHVGGIIGDYTQSGSYTYNNVSIVNNINRGEVSATQQCAAIMGCNNIDGFTAMTAAGNVSYYHVEGLVLFGNPEDMVIDATNKFIVPVAQVGTETYNTLAEAVADAQNGETIILIGNVVLAERVTIPADKTLTIDLNGKSISMEESIIATAYAINNLGDLTITDGVGGGSINARGVYNGYGDGGANVATAKITVVNGTINAKGTNGGGAAIFNYGVADIQGGTFTSAASYAIALQTGSTMTIGKNAIITGGINSWQSTLTITDGTISNDKSGKHVVYAGESTVAINGGTFHNNNSGNATIMASGSTAAVEITGGTFTLNIVDASSSYLIDATSSATYTISGGSFTGGIRAQGGTKYEIAGGTFTNEYGNYNVYEGGDINISGGTFTGSYAQTFAKNNIADGYKLGANGAVVQVNYVAKIGETKYETLNEAVEAVQDDGTITLIANETFTKTNRTHNSGTWYDGLYYVGDKSFTIDLGGFTISQDGAVNDYLLNFKNSGSKANTITLKNGTIDAGTAAFCAICTSSSQANELTINTEDINIINNISNGSTIKLRGGAVLNVKDGTKITGKNSYLGIECVASTVNIFDGAEIYMNGTSSYNGCLVGACGGGTVNVYGGYGKGAKGGFIAMTSGGTINVEGGEWIANTDGSIGNNSNVYVLTAQSNKNEQGFVGPAIINVTGGTFRGGMDAWVLNNLEGEKAELNIKGGNFNANPTSYVAKDYIAVKNNDVWNVVKAAAKVGEKAYATLEEAFKAATDGCTIDILSDVTVDYNWDARNTGAKFTVPVTINGNGNTIKFTASVNDNNYQAPFRFEADATVKNLIVDMSEVTDNRFRAISSKGNLTVDSCKFIGKDESLNCRAIIFGEGAGANVGNLAVAITNSEFINWKRGITDNENGQDVKTVTITGNKLTDAAVYVSATSNVTFTDNTVAGAYVNIKSYTAGNKLAVTATGNTLEANTETAYNVINAGGKVEAEEGFNVVAKGGSIIGYTSTEGIYGEVWGNSRESFVIKVVDAQGNVMGTTSLNNVDGIIDGDVYVTWNIKFNAAANTDEYWTMAWTTAPTINNMPAKVQLWVDGTKVSEGNVVLNGPDDLWPIAVAVTDENGVIKSCAQTLEAAVAAGNNVAILKAGTYALKVKDGLTITGAVEGVEFANIGAFGCNGANVTFNNVTFTYAENSTYKGLQHSGNLVYNNCTFNGQVFLYGQSETFNNCTFNTTDSNNYNVWTYGAKNVAFNECTFNSAGMSVLIYAESASVTNNVTVTKSTFKASQAVDGKAAIEMDASLSGAINLTIDAATTATGFAAGNVSGNSLWNNKKGNADDANNDITVVVAGETVLAPVYEAKIGEKNYRNLQDAINAVQNGETVVIVKDFTGNITLTEKEGLYYTIDGADKQFKGSISVNSLSDTNDNRRITIKNIKFVDDSAAKVDFISSVATNHYPRLTVEGCTFTGSGDATDVAVRLKSSHSVVIQGCTATGLHSFIQNTSGWNLTIENVKVTDSKSAFALGTVQGVTIKGCEATVEGYGIRLDAQYNNEAVIESNTIEAFIPVVVRKAEVNSNVTVQGENTMTATNTDGLWMAVGTSEYETNGEMPTAATAEVKVVLTDTGLDAAGIYGSYYDALTIHVGAAQNSRMVTRDIYVATMDDAVAEAKAISAGAVIYKVYGEVELTTGGSHGILDLGKNVVIEGADAKAKLTIVGGGVPDIKGVTFRNITLADEGTYLPTADEFMYQNYIDCTFEYVTFVDGIRLSGTSSIKDSKVDANTTNEYAIWLDEGEFTMTGTTVVGGADAYGLVKSDAVSKITITGNTFQYLGEANKEALNVKEAVVIAENNQFIDCVKGILPADKTNYTDDSKTTVATDAAIAGNNTVTVYYAAVGEQKFETLLEAINAVQDGKTITLLRDVTMDYNARDAYETQAQNVVINGNGKVLTLNQKNSDWASFGLAGDSKLVLNNMTIEKTGYGDTSGAWNTHAIIFSCPVEMTDVTVNNAVAVQAGAALTNVNINEANGYYGLWINGNGQTVTVNGGSITATNGGRGIKIADEYIDAPAQVTLNVTGTVFSTAKKAAVLVSSTAGAKIAADNVNIENVAEDKVNFVWVDEDWAQHFGNVEVTGATVRAEGVAAFTAAITANGAVQAYYKTLAEAVKAAKAGETITLLQNVNENVTISKNLTIDGAYKTITGMITTDGKSLKVTIKKVHFDGNNGTINYAMRADDDINLVVENCTASNYIYGFLYANKSNDKIVVKDVTVENCAEYGAYLVSFNNATFENFTVKGNTKYGIAVANAGARTVNLKNVTFKGADQPLHVNENGTGKVTFNFSGSNDMSKAEFYTSQYVKVVAAAQVGTKVCGSLQDAVVAANNGETVKVLADVNMTTANFVTQVDGYATLVNVVGKAVTIDLNGKKVTVNAANADLNGKANGNMLMSVFHADPNGTLTLTDSSAEGTGTVELIANDATVYGLIVSENAYDKSNPGKIIINGGNYIADRLADSMIFADINEVITVNGGNFHLGNVGSSGVNGKPWIFNASGNNQMHINVNGGTYNANVAKQHWTYEVNLGEGLTTTNNGDGTWTVVPAVATVGEESFGSIQEAIDAAQDGNTVKLIADVVYTDADIQSVEEKPYTTMLYVQGKNIILDLNGKNIDVTYTGSLLYSVVLVSDGAGLTVTGEGSINVRGLKDGTAAKNIAYVFWKRGETGYLTIENGTFHMNDAADSMVYTNGDEIVTINGGTFILDAVASQTNGFPVIFSTHGNNEKQIVVNAGTFNYDINHHIRPFEPYVAPEKAVKKVGDMWTIVPAQAYVTELLGEWVTEPGTREHNVGYATVAEAIAATNNLGKTVTILAGEYTQNLNVNKAITVKGEVDAEGNNLVTFNGKLSITADGATVENLNFNNSGTAAYVGAKNVTIDGCSLVGSNGLYQSYTSGTVTFKNSTITGATYGIHFDGSANGNIVIENCTITGWTSFASTIENVTISGTTFAEGNYNQLRLYQNATITGCTFNENMTVDFGKNGTTAAFENCTVENGGNLLDVIYIADIAEMGILVTIDDVPVSVAAKVNGKYYLTLQAAIDAATEGQIVTIVSDIALTEGVTVAADDNLFIDLNGKTVSMKDATAATAALIKNNGTLTIEDSSDAKAGKLSFETTTPSAANAYASNTISNYGTLTINAGTVENLSTGGACYALDNYAGSTATINGGKLTAEKTAVRVFNWTNGEANAAELNVVGGEIFSNDGYGININAGNAPYVDLNISGGTITTNDTDYNLAVYVVNKNSAENFTANISGGTFNGNLALNGVTSTTMAKGNVSVSDGTFDGVICYGEPAHPFISGGSYMTEFTETYLAWGYQLTGDAAPYTVTETGKRAEVTIVDGKVAEFVNENDIEVGTLTYKRTLPSKDWQSLYVPFEIPVATLTNLGYDVAYTNDVHFEGAEDDGIVDEIWVEYIAIKSGTLKANFPYVIRATSDEALDMEIVLEDATLYATATTNENKIECSSAFFKFEFVGTYNTINRVDMSEDGTASCFALTKEKGLWAEFTKDEYTLSPFRVYMTMESKNGSPIVISEEAKRSIGSRVVGEENEDGTTTIYDVVADREVDGTIYDLQGRKVLEITEPGIYIINGKKVFIK